MEQNSVKPMKKITGMLDILICLLLFISALYKGGFYKEDSLFISLVICMLGLVCLSVKIVLNIRDNRKLTKSRLGTIVDICVMLMPVAYFLPVLFGTYASREAAIFESIRYVNLAIVYFIVRTTSNKKIYLTSIVLIGVILAILGIDEMTYRVIGEILKPLSINYLAESGGKLSSTLQYANITGLLMLIAAIIVQDKLIKNIPNLKKESSFKFKVLVILELFCLILLQSAVLLTTSRMNTLLMIGVSIIYSVYCKKQDKKKSALVTILMLIAAFALVTSIETYMLSQNNFMVLFTYVITLVLIILGVFLSTTFSIKQNKKNVKLNINKKLVYVATTLIFTILALMILFIPKSLKVGDNTKQGHTVTRNIYTNLEPTMDLEITFKFYKNNNFELHLYEVNDKFQKTIVVSPTKENVVDNKYKAKIKINEDTKNLLLTFTTIDSDISIESFKLNGKDITLSYMFMPDSLMFRVKDTLIKDSNNSLRLTYYKDALKLFNKSKLFGIGGEGFKARYQEVQTEAYISSEVHSTPLQILVESGIVGIIIFLTICVSVCAIVLRLCKNKNEEGLVYLLILAAFLITAAFDLVFSFGIMICLFAIILGLIIGEYKKGSIIACDKYELDNKSILGMIKIATLSVSLMALFMVTIYSLNIYRASMYIVPEDEGNLEASYNRVGILENKAALDKYNLAYLNSLLSEYDTHIDLLNEIYLLAQESEEKEVLKAEINNYIVKQKEVADNIIECEYYNKYAIEQVARCYFKRYVYYADIYDENFKNDEIAYVFYVGYAIKLTDRLTEIGKVNKLAHSFAINIYNEYLPIIEKQNKLINSSMLEQAIEDMKVKLEQLKMNN